MKINLELDKNEAKKILGMKTPLKKAGEDIIKFFKGLNHKVNKCDRTQHNKIAFYSVLIILMVVGLAFGFNQVYNVGYSEGALNQIVEYEEIIKSNNYEYLSKMSLGEVASSVGKRIIIAIGNNLSILFLIIGISWIIHGVGFKVI